MDRLCKNPTTHPEEGPVETHSRKPGAFSSQQARLRLSADDQLASLGPFLLEDQQKREERFGVAAPGKANGSRLSFSSFQKASRDHGGNRLSSRPAKRSCPCVLTFMGAPVSVEVDRDILRPLDSASH